MAISQGERERIIAALDSMEDTVARAVIATMESFAAWLEGVMPTVFQRFRDRMRSMWESLRKAFA